VIPGEILSEPGDVALNAGRDAVSLTVENTGDRPVQVGSHFHFSSVNSALRFDRDVARGYRLDIPAGTSVRFEPGVSRHVALVRLSGRRIVRGLQLGSAAAADNPEA
jgi:urease beta subunit